MLAIERRNEILEKLQAERRVVVSELSRIYDVSEETIRRDLEKLENDGYAIKSYGGAVINENSNIDLPFNIRKNRNVAGKQKIAELVCDMVHEGDRLILDASSTAVFVAKMLKGCKKKLIVITNSIEIIIELFGVPDWYLISTGGVAKEGSLALVGSQTDKMLEEYYVDKAIISCKGLDLDAGMTDSDEMHAKNKQTMLHSAKEKILVVDSSKFGEIGFARIGKLSSLTTVITNEKPGDDWLKELEELGITCIYPD